MPRVVSHLELRDVADTQDVHVVTLTRLRPRERLHDGIGVVAVIGEVDVVAESLDVTELIERDRLRVVAAVRRRSCTSGTT